MDASVYEERNAEKFGRLSGDDQGIHADESTETHVAFHLVTNGVLSRHQGLFQNPHLYLDGLAQEADFEDEVDALSSKLESGEKLKENIPEDYKPERVVQGVYSTARVIAQLPDLVGGVHPRAVSAEHSRPVHYGGEFVAADPVEEDGRIPLRKSEKPGKVLDGQGEVFAEHEVLAERGDEVSEEEIDYELMAYALTKGMSFEERNGDVLLAFPYIEFTDYDRDELNELNLAERTLLEDEADIEDLEYVESDILEQVEGTEGYMRSEIEDESVEVNLYRNILTDQDGEKVLEYGEIDLQGVDYPESTPSVAEPFRELISVANPFNTLGQNVFGD